MSRYEWLDSVRETTRAYREWRASEYLRAGERPVTLDGLGSLDSGTGGAVAGDGVLGGLDDLGAEGQVNPWHASRARAQVERFERLEECASRVKATHCDCGGHKPRAVKLTCDHWRLCVACRGRRVKRDRARFEAGRAIQRRRCGRKTARHTAGGRWSEKFLTLTVPHGVSVARDIEELRTAWPLFRGRLTRLLAASGTTGLTGEPLKWRDVPYWRSLEVAGEGYAHAHYHVWLLCPYVPQEDVARAWRESLSDEYRARLDAAGAEFPVVDIRAANRDVALELSKYIVKDFAGRDVYMDPRAYARVYAALDGFRVVATSTGWSERQEPPPCWCESCGSILESRIKDAPRCQEAPS